MEETSSDILFILQKIKKENESLYYRLSAQRRGKKTTNVKDKSLSFLEDRELFLISEYLEERGACLFRFAQDFCKDIYIHPRHKGEQFVDFRDYLYMSRSKAVSRGLKCIVSLGRFKKMIMDSDIDEATAQKIRESIENKGFFFE